MGRTVFSFSFTAKVIIKFVTILMSVLSFDNQEWENLFKKTAHRIWHPKSGITSLLNFNNLFSDIDETLLYKLYNSDSSNLTFFRFSVFLCWYFAEISWIAEYLSVRKLSTMCPHFWWKLNSTYVLYCNESYDIRYLLQHFFVISALHSKLLYCSAVLHNIF